MNENMYLGLNAFFNSYKSYIDYIGMKENNYYEINVKKNRVYEGFTKINISVVDNRYNIDREERINSDKAKNNFFSFDNYIILPDNLANILTSKIRDDFRDNYFINYATIKTETPKRLNLKNSKFTLHIDLDNEDEIKEAERITLEINCNERKNNTTDENKSFLLKFKNYFTSYRNYIYYIGLTNSNNRKYRITVKKTKLEDDLSKVSVLIDDISYDIDGENRRHSDKRQKITHSFENHIIIPDNLATELIYEIKDDFLNNHKINYATVNTYKNKLNLKNTIFTLCIELTNDKALSVADQIRESINCPKRVLKVSK